MANRGFSIKNKREKNKKKISMERVYHFSTPCPLFPVDNFPSFAV
jgi:hypothetical protein